MKNNDLLDNELIEPEIERNTDWVSIVGYGCIYALYFSFKFLVINALYNHVEFSIINNTDISLLGVIILTILTLIITLIIIIITNSFELTKLILWLRNNKKCLNNDISRVVIIIYLYHALGFVMLYIISLVLGIPSIFQYFSGFTTLMLLILIFIIAFIVMGKVNKHELELTITHESNK